MTNPEKIQSTELKNQLRLNPFLELPVAIDHEACFREAIAHLDRFVAHREYGWKSLALRALGGDSSKTEYHTTYGETSDGLLSKYRETEVLGLCPKTREFLEKHFDLEQAFRIRFMLLEPGATISLHSDDPNSDLGLGINIALNHPDDCEFHIDFNPDGTENEFTQTIPFSPGKAFLINIAKYHRVENRSSMPRIHLIVHAPIRISEEKVLEQARRRSGIVGNQVLLQKLIVKHSRLGNLDAHPHLLSAWRSYGWTRDVFPDRCRFAIVDDSIWPWAERDFPRRATTANQLVPIVTLFQEEPETISIRAFSRWCRARSAEGVDQVIALRQGVYFPDPFEGILSILHASHESEKRQKNLTLVNELGKWGVRILDRRWGWDSSGETLPDSNFLLAGDSKSAAAVRSTMEAVLEHNAKKVFFLNTEPLQTYSIPGFRPTRLVTLGAGIKFSGLLSQYWKSDPPAQIVVTDFVDDALNYARGFARSASFDSAVRHVYESMKTEGSSTSFAEIAGSLRDEIRRASRDEKQFLRNCDWLSRAEFVKTDLLEDHEFWIRNATLGTVFWFSNVWSYSSGLCRYSKDELTRRFLGVVERIARKHGLRVWKAKGDDSCVFGKSFEEPQILLAAAGNPKPYRAENFVSLF